MMFPGRSEPGKRDLAVYQGRHVDIRGDQREVWSPGRRSLVEEHHLPGEAPRIVLITYVWGAQGDGGRQPSRYLADSWRWAAMIRVMNRFFLTGMIPAAAFSALATCSSIPRRGAAAAVGAVLVVDGLVPAVGGLLRPGGRPGLGEDLPSGRSWPACSRRHRATGYGSSGMRVPG